MRNRTYPPQPQTNWINIVLVGVFVVLGLAILAAVAPAIIRNWNAAPAAQPTAFVQTQPTNVNPANDALPLPTAAPSTGNPPVAPAPLVEAAPAAASGLTESMERTIEEAAPQTGVAGEILDVVSSWNEATPIPGEPPEDKGGGKSLGRPVGGGSSGGAYWGQP